MRPPANPREAAFLALCAVHRSPDLFLSHYLEDWRRQTTPSSRDAHLAQELAYGTERRLLTLDAIAKKLCVRATLPTKLKEKMLLRLAIYQHLFLDRIPPHALVSEMVELAKKYADGRYVRFLNAALRRLVEGNWQLSKKDKSLFYSYPSFFIEKLTQAYGEKVAEEILEAMNSPPPLYARKRWEKKDPFLQIVSSEALEEIAKDPAYYIQNKTQPTLLLELAQDFMPQSILDLCSAPGGKLILLSELFPHAELTANDLSEKRVAKLQENLRKYQISARLTCHRAEKYPQEEKFDLILLDAPCTNSGVLHKRPEARWRIDSPHLTELREIQWQALKRAASLLDTGGQIWYMTCSILAEENEALIERACSSLALTVARGPFKRLPDKEGWDGGFACSLTKEKR